MVASLRGILIGKIAFSKKLMSYKPELHGSNSCFSYTERGLLYKKAFYTNGLMRMRLHPDASKMLICTTSGYIMVVHDLNLETLPADLYGFKVIKLNKVCTL